MESGCVAQQKSMKEMNKWEHLTHKRFSTAHPDASTEGRKTSRFFYECWKNASQSFRDEQFDIYFGKTFHYKDISWGNVMGVEASDDAMDWLFRAQDDFGIPISLTMNQMNIPVEMLSGGKEFSDAFIDWLGEFHKRGLRSCTICSPHMMRTGVLQRNFADMIWKNTVNQIVDNAQKVVNCIALGYNFIQLDRSLNRNVGELRNIKKYVDEYNRKNNTNVVTCLLVAEACLPFCPYKREHDDIQAHHTAQRYSESPELGGITCNTWRSHPQYGALPRAGTNCFWNRRDTFKTYADLVDVFKTSGRLINWRPDDSALENTTPKHCYGVVPERVRDGKATELEKYRATQDSGYWIISRDSFADILEENLVPLMAWDSVFRDVGGIQRPPGYDELDEFHRFTKDHFWNTKEYYDLETILMNCKNECWKCHKCEDAYGVPHIDSLVGLPRVSLSRSSGAASRTVSWSAIRDATSKQ